MNNLDTMSQNFYLYSPIGTQCFLPKDYGGAWDFGGNPSSDPPRWSQVFLVCSLHDGSFANPGKCRPDNGSWSPNGSTTHRFRLCSIPMP
jgi:hypothetical protein